MDKQCNIVRDLMPLVIDEAASEDSAQFVADHTEKCAECAAYYQGMRAMLPKTDEAAGERKQFSRAAKKLRARRWKRLIAWVCAGVMLIMLLLLGIQFARYRLTGLMETPMRLGDYQLLLSAQESGRCVVTIRQAAPNIESGLNIRYIPENGGMTMYVNLNTAIIPQDKPNWTYGVDWHRDLLWDDEGLYYLSSSVRVPVLKVCKGTPDNSEVVYVQGDDITPASGAMEEFFALWDEYERMRDFPTEEEWYSETFRHQVNEAYRQTEALRNLVPEWTTGVRAPAVQPVMTPTLLPAAGSAAQQGAEAMGTVIMASPTSAPWE